MLWACDAIGCEVALCGSKWLCDDVVIQSNYYSEQKKYYNVLRSTTLCKVLLRTTKYSPVLYYNSVLQLCATKYYSVLQLCTTTLYYKVLHSTALHYKVLHSTTLYFSVLQSTTPYYSVLQSITLYYKAHMKRPVQCAEQQESSSNFTQILLHQILRLPRKMNLMIDPRHI